MTKPPRPGKPQSVPAAAPASPRAAKAQAAPPEPPPRTMYTMRLAALVPRLTRPAFKKRSPAGALLMADWALAVGPELAAQTTPQRLSGSVLTIACSGAMAMELSHRSRELIARINAYAGERLVSELRFLQSAPALPPPTRPRKRHAPEPIAGLPPGELNDALARIAAALKDRDG